jgi:hypothetical protein
MTLSPDASSPVMMRRMVVAKSCMVFLPCFARRYTVAGSGRKGLFGLAACAR